MSESEDNAREAAAALIAFYTALAGSPLPDEVVREAVFTFISTWNTVDVIDS